MLQSTALADIRPMMPIILLHARVDEETRGYGLFELTAMPDRPWLQRFERCLSRHGVIAVDPTGDRTLRIGLPAGIHLSELTRLVHRCVDQANLADVGES